MSVSSVSTPSDLTLGHLTRHGAPPPVRRDGDDGASKNAPDVTPAARPPANGKGHGVNMLV